MLISLDTHTLRIQPLLNNCKLVTLIAEDSSIVVLSMFKGKEKAQKVNQLSWGLPSPVNNVKFSGKGSVAFADSIKSAQLEFLVKVVGTSEAATHFEKPLWTLRNTHSALLQNTEGKDLNVARE